MTRNLSEGLRFCRLWTRFYSFDITWCLSSAPRVRSITNMQWYQLRPIFWQIEGLLNAGILVLWNWVVAGSGCATDPWRAAPFCKEILCTALRKRSVCFKSCSLVWRKFNQFSRCGNLYVNQIAGFYCTMYFPPKESFGFVITILSLFRGSLKCVCIWFHHCPS